MGGKGRDNEPIYAIGVGAGEVGIYFPFSAADEAGAVLEGSLEKVESCMCVANASTPFDLATEFGCFVEVVEDLSKEVVE